MTKTKINDCKRMFIKHNSCRFNKTLHVSNFNIEGRGYSPTSPLYLWVRHGQITYASSNYYVCRSIQSTNRAEFRGGPRACTK